MKSAIFRTVSILFLLLFILSLPVSADDGSLGRTPEGVYPVADNNVEMESENIVVDLVKGKVDCSFTFHNTGGSSDCFMGFPGKLADSFLGDNTEAANLELRNFHAFVKGSELSVKHEKGDLSGETSENGLKYKEWFTFTVPFEAGERLTVRNTYDVSFSAVSTGDIFAGYVLKTGALWKGTIGNARVEFKLGDINPWQVDRLGPGGFIFKDNSIIWERSDFEPLYDLSVIYNTWHYTSEFLDSLEPGVEKDRLLNKISRFKNAAEYSVQNDMDKLLELHKLAISENDPVLLQYVDSFIPAEKLTVGSRGLGPISVDPAENTIKFDLQGMEPASIKLKVSHMEGGKETVDGEFDSAHCYMTLLPGIDYDITCTIRDWLDREYRQSSTYRAPESAAGTTEQTVGTTGPITGTTESAAGITESTAITTLETDTLTLQPAVSSAPAAADNPGSKKTSEENNGGFLWIISGAVLIAAVIAYFTLKRRA